MSSLSITFARGARRVTGSNFLVEVKNDAVVTRLLIDCGLSQGEKFCESVNNEKFSYDAKTIDVVLFTHAHADHIGLFPKLVKEGFQGKAYATGPTKDLMPIMLEDSVNLIDREAKQCNEAPPYDAEDLRASQGKVTEVSYGQVLDIGNGVRATFNNAGHILGSATILIEAHGKRILFTGDLGRVPAIIVPDRTIPGDVDVLITESVYGNREHEPLAESEELLMNAVRGIIATKGVLLIPAFSLERTQIILSILDKAISEKKIDSISVYMDSPLAAKVTEVYRQYPEFLRDDAKKKLESGDDPFSFSSLRVTVEKEESDSIERAPGPKIIIAGAGMSHGGRIRRHESRYLPEKNTVVLLVGYQVPGSLGRRIKDGAKMVTIDGVPVKVRAKILSANGFSAHADRNDLMDFAEAVHPKRVFVVLGDTEASTFLAQRISGFLGISVDVPREGESYEV
jgi:metallo-beta-lactamase family protein